MRLDRSQKLFLETKEYINIIPHLLFVIEIRWNCWHQCSMTIHVIFNVHNAFYQSYEIHTNRYAVAWIQQFLMQVIAWFRFSPFEITRRNDFLIETNHSDAKVICVCNGFDEEPLTVR